MFTLVLALACSAETGFSASNTDPQAATGDAVAVISPGELFFEDAVVGTLYAQEITISSEGTDELLIYSAQIIDDNTESFEIANGAGQEQVKLEPTESTSFLVHLQLATETSAYASLALQTNDAEQLTVLLPLSATPAPPEDTGDTGL